ncbi:hypothetical protein D3C85_1152850 [compost metagenome]
MQADQLRRTIVRRTWLPRRDRQRLPIALAAARTAQVVQCHGRQRQGVGFLQAGAQWHIADALVRHLAQLLGALRDQLRPVRLIIQHQRVHAGKPAQGTADIQARVNRLAAMAFQQNPLALAQTHLAQGTGQRCQQQAAHLAGKYLGGVLAQLLGQPRFQLEQMHLGWLGADPLRRNAVIHRRHALAPEAQLRAGLQHIGKQALTPLPVAAGLGRQRFATVQARQVIGEDAPGHRIDHQVVTGDKQPTALRQVFHQRPAQAAPQHRLKVTLQLGQRRLQTGLAQFGVIEDYRCCQRQILQVALAVRRHRQAQGIVML